MRATVEFNVLLLNQIVVKAKASLMKLPRPNPEFYVCYKTNLCELTY